MRTRVKMTTKRKVVRYLDVQKLTPPSWKRGDTRDAGDEPGLGLKLQPTPGRIPVDFPKIVQVPKKVYRRMNTKEQTCPYKGDNHPQRLRSQLAEWHVHSSKNSFQQRMKGKPKAKLYLMKIHSDAAHRRETDGLVGAR
jgi:hypothetical protein